MAESTKIAPRMTVPRLLRRKVKSGDSPLVMVTAYDSWQARLGDAAGADMLLVGDSVGMTTLGMSDTLAVDLATIIHHTKAVMAGQKSRKLSAEPTMQERRRGARRALVVADMPFGSYGVSVEDGVRNGVRLLAEGGANAVKLEGAGGITVETVHRLTEIGVPIMGHLGMTPQASNRFGGFKVQGTTDAEAERLHRELTLLTEAGIFGVILELIPDDLAAALTDSASVPTIGIGAGLRCDGQVQVLHDLIGLSQGATFKHTRRYLEASALIEAALGTFADDVRSGGFPES